jgi:hypothetical protein
MCKITNKFTFEDNENREAFYEGVYERMLAIQNEEYDYGQYDEEFEEEEKDNCEICNDVLLNHIYGNVCKKHIPSYALYDDDDEEEFDDDDEEEFDEDNEEDDDIYNK